MTQQTVTIHGILGGPIWMPACVCSKSFQVSDQQYPYGGKLPRTSDAICTSDVRPTLREMVLRAVNDGDFQHAEIAEGTVTFKRITTRPNGTRVIRRRDVDIRKFPSVADCLVSEESERYYEIVESAYGDS